MKKWRFLSNQNSTIVGINDAGIETFTANMNRSLVRETIQNSLDAAIDEGKEPVEVEFVKFELPKNNIPDIDEFQKVITKCKNSNENEPDAYKFFHNAEIILSRQKVSILRISDHKTKGLEGTDTCAKGTSWSRLVKESGSSNKGQGSGGSFGIGKAAAFACSDLRTVFYSSEDVNGLVSNFGVARLVSFENQHAGDWTTGVGYYSEDEKFVAIKELASFDSGYSRTDSGTDIYVIGMHEENDFKESFIRAVLLDFLVSIVKRKLVVKVQDEIINEKSLPKYMSKLNPHGDEEIKNLLEYYHILTSRDPKIQVIKLDSSVYGNKYGFKDGECTLYLKEGEGLNRKIMITRRAGMRILEQNRISGSIDFTGVLVIEGNCMNEAFKQMEVPSHDAWEPGRVRGEEKKYKDILDELKKYLRGTVKTLFGRVTTTSMDALGASDFLPDKLEDTEDVKLQKDEFSTRIKTLDGKTVEPAKAKSKAVDIEEVAPEPGETNWRSGKGPGPGPNPIPGPPHPGPGPGPMPVFSGENPGKEQGFKEIPVKKRLICKNANSGLYNLSLVVPSTASNGKLEFTLSGEQSDFELPIVAAKVLNGNSKVESIIENKIFLTNLEKGKSLKVEVQVDFDEYCMMEVDYYANKK